MKTVKNTYNSAPIEEALQIERLTFNGKRISFGKIDQHLSNIFYYEKFVVKLIWADSEESQTIPFIQRVLDERFNGQLLPYRPHVKFKAEIDALRKYGLLQLDGSIIIAGKEVGEIITIEDFSE